MTDATADPTDRLGNSSVDTVIENATMTLLVVCFLSFWVVTALTAL